MSSPQPHLSSLPIDGVILFNFTEFKDDRGRFSEYYNAETWMEAGFHDVFLQDNITYNEPGILRGMHIQREDPQGKLIRCLKGRIYDAFVDLRPESQTFKKWFGLWLCEPSLKQEGDADAIYIPPGCAHGFYSPDHSLVYYKCTTLYDKSSDGGVNPMDPDQDLGSIWPIGEGHKPIISEKDKDLPSVEEWIRRNIR